MTKSVLLSIQPKWCERIASGEKTVEVRKTRPKIETPFKCYIYCTLAGSKEAFISWGRDVAKWNREKWYEKKSKVIGEFICDDIYQIPIFDGIVSSMDVVMSCLDDEEMLKYAGEKPIYGWHISDLKIYDKPKKLSEFYKQEEKYCYDFTKCEYCEHWGYTRVNAEEFDMDCKIGGFLGYEKIPITRPPQSWCYVEELQ